jgi:glycosyltransferase involved in cell wall biosynthesis
VSQDPNHAEVPPVEDGVPRPQWSVLIPTYHCAQYLEETLRSVLDQDQGANRMEVIVVDDHSTRDNPQAVVQRVGGARVRFIRQERNVGKVRNFETGLRACRGRMVHQLHGDDRVRPGFYAAMDVAFDAFPSAGAFFCESFYIDESGAITGCTGREQDQTGLLDGWLDKIVVEQRIQTPSIVLRREVYESLGGFDRRLNMVEDWEMWIRVANAFPVGFLAGTLADYRVSHTGTTGNAILSGRIVKHIRDMLAVVDRYLPAGVVSRCRRARDRALAQYFTQLIPFLMHRKEYRAVGKVYLEALSFNAHPRTWYRLLYFTRHYRRFLTA